MQICLDGKVALVTGGSRGIGRAIVLALAQCGALVGVNYCHNQATADETVALVEAQGGRARALRADVSDFEQAQALIRGLQEEQGRLDILVNNVGITRDQLLMRMPEQDFDDVLRVNLKSVYNACKAAVRPMMRQRWGRIVNVTSVSGIAGQAGQTNYSATKAGMIGFTKSLAKELGSRQITVNAVAPGFIPTDLTAVVSDELRQALLAATPLGRFGTVEDVAHAVVFLASEQAAFITGAVLAVDGGLVMSG